MAEGDDVQNDMQDQEGQRPQEAAEAAPAEQQVQDDGRSEAGAVDYDKVISDALAPDGVALDPALTRAGSELLARHNIAPEAAKDLASFFARQQKAGAEGNARAFADQVGAWRAQAEILRGADWNCARMTVALDEVTADFAAPARWACRYAWPDDCLKIWRMESPAGLLWRWPDALQGFEVAVDNDPANGGLPTRYIYSDRSGLSAIFTQYRFDIAGGAYEALFEPDLREAIGWALAAMIAGPLTGNGQIIQTARAEALRSLDTARASGANESALNSMDIPEAESLAVRGGSCSDGRWR